MVGIDATKIWCRDHIQPFRIHWPRGFALATMALFEEATRHEDVISYCGGGEGKKADIERLTAAMMEFSPICCLIGDERTGYWTDLALGSSEVFVRKLEEFRKS